MPTLSLFSGDHPAEALAARSPSRVRARAFLNNMILWSLQSWLAMFFIAAGYTKLTEPLPILVQLMGWPLAVEIDTLRALGATEVALALTSLTPLASWRFGRPVLLLSAVGLLSLEVAALTVHALRGDVGLAITNLALIAITLPILIFRAAAAPAPSR